MIRLPPLSLTRCPQLRGTDLKEGIRVVLSKMVLYKSSLVILFYAVTVLVVNLPLLVFLDLPDLEKQRWSTILSTNSEDAYVLGGKGKISCILVLVLPSTGTDILINPWLY
jgi:hypothetical protein